MKIVMASHYFASHRGGVEIVAEELYRGFSERGHEVVWLAGDVTARPDPVGRSRAVGLPVLNFVEKKIGLPFPIPGWRGLKRIRAEIRDADVLLLHDCLYLSNILAFLTARRRRVPTVVVQHIGSFPSRSFYVAAILRLATFFFTRPMLSSAEQVIFVSETTKAHFNRVLFRNFPETVFNGVDTKRCRMRRGDEPMADIRRAFGLPEDGTLILFAGRFVEKKGISVMKKLAERRPDWTWVFAGWGPLNPDQWNTPNVRVLSGLRGASIAGLYRACDLLVLPSFGEGFPLVIQEALASGLPVVCGEESHRADPAIGNLVKGVPVIVGDDESTAREFLRAIDEVLASEATSLGMAEARRTFAVSRYSWARSIDHYLEIVSRLAPNAAESDGRMQHAVEAGPQ